jgi:hypothetical protein
MARVARIVVHIADRDRLWTDNQRSAGDSSNRIIIDLAVSLGALRHRERSRDRRDGGQDWLYL